MTKALAVLPLAAVTGARVASAGSSSAQMTVSVTVVRSCTVDARAGDTGPVLHLTCTNGTQSTLKMAEMVQPPSDGVVTDGSTVLTLNF